VPEADIDVVLSRHADEATVAHTTTPRTRGEGRPRKGAIPACSRNHPIPPRSL
jgi:hypothetical protein